MLWRNRQLVSAVDGASRTLHHGLVEDLRRRMHAFVSRRIVERQRSGALRTDLSPDVMADLVVGAHEDFARRMASLKVKPALASWARSLLVVLYEGLLARPHAAGRRASHR